MSHSILKDIFLGSFIPWEHRIKDTEKYKELTKKIKFEYEYFCNNMSPSQAERFEKYHCLLNERESEGMINQLYQNFMLGIWVGIDIIEHRQFNLPK